MDFYNVLKVAAAKQSNDGSTKRYSLAVGPPKKDPKVKGVQSAAVQAFLRKKDEETRQKELREKRMKEELLAKRKELKHDKKARAMASRTKDNFRGYNGIPVEDKPKKRSSSPQKHPNASGHAENDDYLTEEEMYEFSQTESEQEEVEETPPPPKKQKFSHVKKPPPPAMNFEELLRLAEKKQFEPVEIVKPVKKNFERPRTAEEIREIEFLERKIQKTEKTFEKPAKTNSQVVKVSKSSSDKHSSSKVGRSEDQRLKNSSVSKSSSHERVRSGEKGTIKKHSDMSSRSEKPVSVAHSKVSKVSSNGNSKSSSGKELGAKQSSSSRSGMVSTNGKLKETVSSRGSSSGKPPGGFGPSSVRPSGGTSNSRPPGSSNSGSGRPSGAPVSASARPMGSSGSTKSSGGSGSVRPSGSSGSNSVRPSSSSGSVKPFGSSSSTNPSRGGHSTSSLSSARPSGVSGSNRPAGGTPSSASRPKVIPSGRELGSSSVRQQGGPTLGSSRLPPNSAPGRPGNNPVMGSGSKPKCTVVSETISSKNFVPKSANGPVNGMRPGQVNGVRPGQMNGMRSGPPPSGHRVMPRPPGPPLPPITSSYKRVLDDEEFDSDMEDFIDDGGEPQDEISRHIREIFGYDRTKYKDESDYALRYMESTFREQQKEEARSLRLGIQEDLEELRREEEELNRKTKPEKPKMKKR
ncbi:protein SPT2 homolog [Mixophyes fleayi]|uniref:protein SPT2 homolog n=1 Tax=Mixophyes fleayi TaxID=3061075 RepID=UPI003F4DA7DA